MKTININKNEDVKVFFDPITNKISGFAGVVKLYDTEMYIDTRTGIGYDKAIAKFDFMIKRFVSKYKFLGNSKEDTKHDVIVHILESFSKYDPRKNVKLSSFVQTFVNKRLINDLRDENIKSRSATSLNIKSFYIKCSCGNSFNISVGPEDDIICAVCDSVVGDNCRKIQISLNEENIDFTDSQYDCALQTYQPVNIVDKHDFCKLIFSESPKMAKVLELMYFYDYTAKSAAEYIGVTPQAVDIKLKSLRKNKFVKDVFGIKK